MTWLEFVNKAFFQWFFVRLARCTQNIIMEVKVNSASLLPGGDMALEFQPKSTKVKTWYAFIGWIFPLTGWSNGFKYLGKDWNIGLTKGKIK